MAMERGIVLVCESREFVGFKFKRELQNLKANPALNSFLCEIRDEAHDLCLGKVKTQLSSLRNQMKRKSEALSSDFKIN